MGKLEGKVALVTGSGRNIGRATVLKLAGEGANVVVNARSNQQEAEAVAREAWDLGVKAQLGHRRLVPQRLHPATPSPSTPSQAAALPHPRRPSRALEEEGGSWIARSRPS